jgi:hypothetical protein
MLPIGGQTQQLPQATSFWYREWNHERRIVSSTGKCRNGLAIIAKSKQLADIKTTSSTLLLWKTFCHTSSSDLEILIYIAPVEEINYLYTWLCHASLLIKLSTRLYDIRLQIYNTWYRGLTA